LCDRNGLPLHVLASAANTHDIQLFVPLLETTRAFPMVVADRAGARTSCMPTRGTTTAAAAATCTAAESVSASPDAAWKTPPGSAGCAG